MMFLPPIDLSLSLSLSLSQDYLTSQTSPLQQTTNVTFRGVWITM